MSLKAKLTSTICAFFLVLGITIMGVFATPNATVNLGGTITFHATDVYAKISGKIENTANETQPTLDTIILNNETTDGDITSWANKNLEFKSDGSAINITVTIENLATDRVLYATVFDNFEIANVTKTITKGGAKFDGEAVELPASTGAGTSTVEFVLSMEVTDKNTSLTAGLQYGYAIELNSEKIERLAYTFSTDGTKTASVMMSNLKYTKGEITIPSTVINPNDGLEYIVTTIPGYAFIDFESLEKDPDINNVTTLEELKTIIKKYSAPVRKLTLPDTITTIDSMGLAGMVDLYEINIPANLESFSPESLMFSYPKVMVIDNVIVAQVMTNTNLSEVIGSGYGIVEDVHTFYIKNTITDIGDYITTNYQIVDDENNREGYVQYKSIELVEGYIPTLSEDMTYQTFKFRTIEGETGLSVEDIGLEEFMNSQGQDLTVLKTAGAVEIPAYVKYEGTTYPVTKIGVNGFLACFNLTSITIPNSITSIGEGAFLECTGLTSITIPDGVTSIGPYAFDKCSNLTSITIPNSITSIGDVAFRFCSNLTSITIPNSVTSIGSSAFSACSSLTSITIPGGVTSIGYGAFQDCTNLTSITIPNSVTSIGYSAFSRCSKLTYNKISETDEGKYLGNVTNPYLYLADTETTTLTEYTIHEDCKFIGYHAFDGCTNLASITIPDSVTSIGSSAFSGCTGLTSITIPNSVTSIGSSAFWNCESLTSVTIDSKTISTSLTSSEASGYLINYATTVYVKEGFEVGSELLDTTKFTVGSSDKAGYVMYNNKIRLKFSTK